MRASARPARPPPGAGARRLLVVVLLVLPSLLAYLLWLGYRNEIRIAEISTRNLAALIEARLEVTLRHADSDLKSVVSQLPPAAMQRKSAVRYERRMNAELDSRLFSLGEIAGYRVFDAHGDALYASHSVNMPRVNVGDRAYFLALRDDPDAGLVFSEVLTSRTLERPVIIMGRAVRDADGVFLGAALGIIDLEYYRKQFQALELGAQGFVALRRSDTHAQVVRWPELPDAADWPRLADHPLVERISAGEKRATRNHDARPDKSARIVSVHAMDAYPFYFAVGLARDEVLQTWRARAWLIATSTLLLFALVATLLLRLQRMRAREARILTTLADSEAQFRELAQIVPVGICHFDAGGRCTYVNDRHLRLVGRARDEMLGSAWSDFVHPDDREKVRRLWQPRQDMASPFVCEIRYLRPDGGVTHVLSEAQRKTDDSGAVVGYLVAQTDISALKEAEAELRVAKQQAEKANAAKTRFLAAASHDLRQPIQAINLFRAALARTPLSEEQKKIANFLATSVHSLHDLLYSLLDISKLDAGQVRPQLTAVSVHELFKTVDTEFSALAAEKGLRFKLFYPAQDLTLLADPGLLRTVLRNLIDNALKYTERGGILIAARQRQGRARIEVWDTGVGIDPVHGEQLFDEFFQVDNPLRDRTKGLGLGLPIARRMARLLQGDVSYRSRAGRGTVFEIRLELAGEPDSERADTAPAR